MVKDIYDYYIEASSHISLGMVGNHHHSNGDDKHGAHNLALFGTFYRTLNLDSKEPLSSTPYTYIVSRQPSYMSPHTFPYDTAPYTYAFHIPTLSHKLTHSSRPEHHNPRPYTPSFHKDTSSSLSTSTLHTPPCGTLSHTYAFRTSTSHHSPSHT